MPSRHVVASVHDVAPGTSKSYRVKGREIALFNVDGRFYALSNRCPHEGAPLCQGRISGLIESEDPGSYTMSHEGELIRCPWHGWEFDIKTGQSFCDPQGTFVRAYKVSVEPGAELAEGPHVVETISVSVEEDYVVLEV